MQRRLAAILAADVVGYSKLMAEDEAGTLAALKAHRNEFFNPEVAKRGGRVVKLMGDGVLVEFSSVVDAVEAALAVQQGLAVDDGPITLRIGINLGDIIIDDDDIYGDGVNVAARLEALAEPGGICMSSIVHQSLGNRVGEEFADAGQHTLKNIDQPVHVFQWPGKDGCSALAFEAPLTLPDKPSIAILPFDNMSSDPEQEFFADGISEDIITELSKFRSLFVIARNSSFAFKGQSLGLKEVSEKLGVRYVVEGSVRRAGHRVRITAQLIDTLDDAHIWAERYDREMEDIFAVQDEVVSAIVRTIQPHLLQSERQRALRKPPENLDAWENYQRGMWHTMHYRREDRDSALAFFQRAIELDPTFAAAHAGLGYGLYVYIILGAATDREADIKAGLASARRAVQLDEHDPFGYAALTRGYILNAEHGAAITAAEKAISLNSNFALAHFGRAHALWHVGRPAEAVASHEEAIRLSPHDPMMWAYQARPLRW